MLISELRFKPIYLTPKLMLLLLYQGVQAEVIPKVIREPSPETESVSPHLPCPCYNPPPDTFTGTVPRVGYMCVCVNVHACV